MTVEKLLEKYFHKIDYKDFKESLQEIKDKNNIYKYNYCCDRGGTYIYYIDNVFLLYDHGFFGRGLVVLDFGNLNKEMKLIKKRYKFDEKYRFKELKLKKHNSKINNFNWWI